MTDARPAPDGPGRLLDLRIERVAHGGHFVGRHEGRAVFVRHTLPHERVLARVTEGGPDDRFWRADAIEVIEPSADRVSSIWPAAGAGGVGGGEYAHIRLDAQRGLKAEIVAEQLLRLGDTDVPGGVVPVVAARSGERADGTGYRTRIELAVGDDGRAGMFRHRSHDVLPLGTNRNAMPLATDGIAALDVFSRRWPPGSRLQLVDPSGGDAIVLDGNRDGDVTEVVRAAGAERRFTVAANGFWQVHRAAPELLVQRVIDWAAADDARVWDLYSGSGLFTAFLAERASRVIAVESDRTAAAAARNNVRGLPVRSLRSRVDTAVPRLVDQGEQADVVVLDPPRKGAGQRVMAALAATGAGRIVYVACDPAALARDVRIAANHGFRLADLVAFDIFPHTHHVETVALLSRD